MLHILPDTDQQEGAALPDELLATIDATATGSLHRCHLALNAAAYSPSDDPDEWLTPTYAGCLQRF